MPVCIGRRCVLSQSKGGKSQYQKKKQERSSGATKHEVFNSREAGPQKCAPRYGGFPAAVAVETHANAPATYGFIEQQPPEQEF